MHRPDFHTSHSPGATGQQTVFPANNPLTHLLLGLIILIIL